MNNKFNILVIEDTKEIVDLIKLYLENEGYNIHELYDGDGVLSTIKKYQIDLIILDIMLPKLNGYEVLKKIREIYNIPIIILSAKNLDNDIIIGLNLGADDYMVKPFNPLQLVARVNAQIRRFYKLGATSKPEENNKDICVGELKLNCNECKLYKSNQPIELTYMEFNLIKYFMLNPGRVFTKKQIFEEVWNNEYIYSDNTVMVYISKLRDKVEDNPKEPIYIKTIRGLGYCIDKK